MQFSLEQSYNGLHVHSYEPGACSINHQLHQNSILLQPESISPWTISQVDDLNASHLEPIIECHPETFILGSGNQLIFPSHEIAAAIQAAGIGFEVMDNFAACRTYNLLLSEDRQVMLGLIMSNKV